MKFCINGLVALSLILSSQLSILSQTQSRPEPPPQDEPKLVLGTTEIVLDVVVRDKKGRPVKDLKQSDFEVLEDGVRQQVESFRLVLREPNAAEPPTKREAPSAPSAPRDPLADLNLVGLVFDRLSPNARNLAHKAALNYVTESLKPDDFTGVFAIDLSLRVLQPFTNNPQQIRQAIDAAAALSTSTYASKADQVRTLSEKTNAMGSQMASSESAAATAGASRDSAAAGAAGSDIGGSAAELAAAQMTMRMLENYEAMERDQQGYATINALVSVINAMRARPGRKAVIFFSEGLTLPPAVQAQFRWVINYANRANVSIYPVDAAGLRVESGNAEAAREINALGNRRSRQSATGREDTNGAMTKQLERNEDLLRLNPHSGLGQLANETGGFLISETNDLSLGLRRIDEDLRAHYVLSYVPKNSAYDGRFRQIAVKVSRPNVEIQARKGYYAINSIAPTPLFDYEMPALAVLGNKSAASSFPLRLTGLSFPESGRTGLVSILAEAPANAFSYTPDSDKKTYKTAFTILVQVKDESQQVIKKLSQHYPLTGPLDKVEAAKRGEVLFYRETELPPGRYTLEAVAYDAASGKSSVRSTSLEVNGGGDTKLRLSSLVILKRAERLTEQDKQAANPFQFGEVQIYPNVGEPLSKSTAKQLTYFLTAYQSKESKSTPKLTLTVLEKGRAIGTASLDLPAPDAKGRIQYVSGIPIEGFQPGTYELKVTVSDGQNTATRSTSFVIEP